jgi:zinc protease
MSSSAARTARRAILRERVASTAYLWHNYGKSTIGSKETSRVSRWNASRRSTRSITSRTTRCSSITGRIDESKTLQCSPRHLGQDPAPDARARQTYTVEPPQDGERFVALRRVGQGQRS